jgi:hypothetical protein
VLRGYVVGFYVISFLLILGVIATIPSAFWTANNAREEDIFARDILIGLCGVLLAYWVFKDEEDVKNLEACHCIDETRYWVQSILKCSFSEVVG